VLLEQAARIIAGAVIAILLAAGAGDGCRAATSAPVHVLTWNVHGIPFTGAGKRLPRIAGVVGERRPDFVAFEEVWTSGEETTLRRALEPLGYATYRYTRGLLRRGGLLLFWDTSKGWSVSDAVFTRYRRAAPWWRLNELDGLGHKGFLAGNARNADGRAFRIVVTHLQSQYREHGRTYDEIRFAQAQQLSAAVDGSGGLVVAGDFNTMPEDLSGAYPWLLAQGWRDATEDVRRRCQAAAVMPCGTNFDNHSGKLTDDWIDYIFVRGPISADDTELLRNVRADDPYSDHEGILSRLTVSP